MIELEGVIKEYAGRTVLSIPHLLFESGKTYALIGANGSGKTTLLRMLSGNDMPDSGRITFDPAPVAEDIAYMPQKPYAFGFSVLKNVSMALPRGTEKSRANALALEALAQVGMQDFARQRGNRLSGGEQQRMALARMIVQEHRLLLLDEPTSATDIAGNDLVEDALKRYREKTGCTVIFATHSLSQAMRLADEALLLDSAYIAERGPVEKVIREPGSESGKAFLQHWRV
ncbi:MAG: ABC transporter ATP-binding protein [Bacillota bacterium]